jgi:type II secretory pathway component PulK
VLLTDWAALDLPDTLDAPWASPDGRRPLGPGWVEVRVEDEARRIDPNRPAVPDVLKRLVAELDLPADLVPAIEDWIDGDDEERAGGAERSWYAGRPGAVTPANEPLRSLGELGLVRGFDVDLLARLRPFLTVTGEGRVNPNTASPEVLAAWLGDPHRVRDMLAARAETPIACGQLAGCTQRSRHFRVTAVAGVGDVRRAVEATVWIAGREPEIVDWRRLVPPDDAE